MPSFVIYCHKKSHKFIVSLNTRHHHYYIFAVDWANTSYGIMFLPTHGGERVTNGVPNCLKRNVIVTKFSIHNMRMKGKFRDQMRQATTTAQMSTFVDPPILACVCIQHNLCCAICFYQSSWIIWAHFLPSTDTISCTWNNKGVKLYSFNTNICHFFVTDTYYWWFPFPKNWLVPFAPFLLYFHHWYKLIPIFGF